MLAVDPDHDVELRRLRITNLAARPRTLSVTSYAELVLAAPATDAAHPAFSKMFVETQIDAALGAIVATRRPSTPDEARTWLFHLAAVQGSAPLLSFETARMHFIGRGRDVQSPKALLEDGALGGHAGPVLDAIAAIRVPLGLEPRGTCTIDWFTGIAASRDASLSLARACRDPRRGDRLLGQANRYRSAALQRIGVADRDARLYERLAAALLEAHPDLRGSAADIARNRRGQADLWAMGISGDLPIALLEVTSVDQVAAVRELVQAHAFWTAHGIGSDLVLWVGTGAAALPALLDAVRQAAAEAGGAERIGKPGGVFVCDGATFGAPRRTLLHGVARIVLDAGAGGLAERVERRSPLSKKLMPDARSASGQNSPHAGPEARAWRVPAADTRALLEFNGVGGYAPDRREYVIVTSTERMTPAPWINVIANPEFGTVVSESGGASTWSENAHEFRLTPWYNDPVSDPSGEALYIRDEESGRFWSPTLLPARGDGAYVARHGFGYSIFEHARGRHRIRALRLRRDRCAGQVLRAEAAQPLRPRRAGSRSPATSNGCSATSARRR